jgi:hypothetical protein
MSSEERCSIHGEIRNAHKILVGTSEWRRPLRIFSIVGRMILKRNSHKQVVRV